MGKLPRTIKEIGAEIKRIRLDKNLSCRELSILAGDVTEKEIDGFENGVYDLDVLGFLSLCKALGINAPEKLAYK